jgi:hypothetical protein
LVPVVDFANSIIIGTQIYDRLRNWMPTATDTISSGTDWREVFHHELSPGPSAWFGEASSQ